MNILNLSQRRKKGRKGRKEEINKVTQNPGAPPSHHTQTSLCSLGLLPAPQVPRSGQTWPRSPVQAAPRGILFTAPFLSLGNVGILGRRETFCEISCAEGLDAPPPMHTKLSGNECFAGPPPPPPPLHPQLVQLRQPCLPESPRHRLGTNFPCTAGKASLFHLVAIGGKAFGLKHQ